MEEPLIDDPLTGSNFYQSAGFQQGSAVATTAVPELSCVTIILLTVVDVAVYVQCAAGV